MDREERQEWEIIPEAEIEEDSEYVMYDAWDKVRDWLRRK